MATIEVTVVSAANLMKDDDGPFNGSDPYVYITLEDCEAQRTATVSGSSDPEWNETLTFEGVENPASKVMKLRVYDDDWGRDDKIGECVLDLGKLVATDGEQEFERVVDDGIFSDATMTFKVKTDGSWGNPEGGAGNLKVTVKSCTGLDDADFAGTTDPYAYLTIEGCEPQQTEKKEGTVNPEWDQELSFEGIENPLSKTLKIKIYDDDTWSRDDKIGECEVDLAELKMGEGAKDYELGVDFALFGLIK
eukprot:CAMPEP_0179359170 /NCGR_PEP_ID=MMETSP0797-20121207/79304_1 /TAXON_ID=47934 /ORGANISM="Dinophysis acuminata, Strain DAEP01" /LENGTH=248 /DNA_ID=CAMNT_0021074447 /DNA_START=61 /DNA_END=804 /DNA_ORIENTATION=-